MENGVASGTSLSVPCFGLTEFLVGSSFDSGNKFSGAAGMIRMWNNWLRSEFSGVVSAGM